MWFSVLVYNTIKYVSCIRYAICITGTRSVGRADQSLWRGEQEREKEQSQSPSLPGTVRVVLCWSVVFAWPSYLDPQPIVATPRTQRFLLNEEPYIYIIYVPTGYCLLSISIDIAFTTFICTVQPYSTCGKKPEHYFFVVFEVVLKNLCNGVNSFPPPPISLSFAYLMNTTGQARLPELLHLDDSVLPQVTIKDPVNAVDAPPDQVLLLQTPA